MQAYGSHNKFQLNSGQSLIYALCLKLVWNDYVQGWTSLMLCILFIGGIQLIGIGIIGEYISRISDNVKKRPLYVVSETNIELI